MEFRINRIELLCDIRAKLGRYLDIAIPMNKLNDSLVQRIATALQNGSGRTQVRMKIITDQTELRLPSNAFNKVNIETDALTALQEIEDIDFEVSES
jgi:hypothetical protein